jgi:recombinational DNA repair protein RecR
MAAKLADRSFFEINSESKAPSFLARMSSSRKSSYYCRQCITMSESDFIINDYDQDATHILLAGLSLGFQFN